MNTAEPRGTNPGLCNTDAVTNGCETSQRKDDHMSIVAQGMRQTQSPVSLPEGDPIEELIKAARAYNDEGLKIFVIGKGAKHPGDAPLFTRWQKDWLQVGRNPIELLDEHETAIRKHEYGSYGLWLATGQVSKRVVLDVDDLEAENHWRDELGDYIFDRALKATSGRRDPETGFVGKHLHFRIRPDDERPWPSHSGDAGSETGAYDFRGDGGGVVMAPTMHKSGAVYEWVGGELMDAPECLRKEEQPKPTTGRSGGHGVLGDLQLSADDPGRGNNWLTRVAGHFAKHYRGSFDMYEAILSNLNQASADPIDDADFSKTINQIWKTEQSNADPGLVGYEQSNGWLVGHAGRLFTLCNEGGDGEEKVLKAREWGNFDPKVTGIATYADGTRRYLIDLHVGDRVIPDVEVELSALSTDARANGWLATFGANILPAPHDIRGGYAPHGRLTRYVTGQDAPESVIVDHLGWDRQHRQYLTNTGVIVAGAQAEARFGPVRPSRKAIEHSRVHFGFEVSSDEAVGILRQVLTFHDETAMSVMAAWMVMRLLAEMYKVTVHPSLQVEGKSGSSKTKTTHMLIQLILGSKQDGGGWSKARAEGAYASNAGGVVWFDDTDIDKDLQELIRIATTGGSKAKMSAGDFTKVGDTRFRASTIITSEGLTDTYNAQQANRERAVRVELPPVQGRMSYNDPKRTQWEADVKPLWLDRFGGDFTQVAGALLAAILEHADAMGDLDGATRVEQAYGILRGGARVLASLLDDPEHVVRVDKWISERQDLGGASTVTLEVVPGLWADRRMPTTPGANGVVQPVFLAEGKFHVNANLAAPAWKAYRGRGYTTRDASVADQSGIKREMQTVASGSKQINTGVRNDKGGTINVRYWVVDEKYTKIILDKATGND